MSTKQQEISSSIAQAPEYQPARILEIELGHSLSALSALDEKTGRLYQRALCLVRLHTQPLGMVEFHFDEQGVSASVCAHHIWHSLQTQINDHLRQDALPEVTMLDERGLPTSTTPRCIEEREQFLEHAPFVSVIISTRDRPEAFQACLRSLMALHYPHYEVIVVDNAPTTSATADHIEQMYADVPQVRYIREDRPGLSIARNCGIEAAKGEILAFTDDDVVVDAYWLVELVRGFRVAENVACVTGLVLPLELETLAQFWFEEYGGFSKGFTRLVFDMKENRPEQPLHPYMSGRFGSGASMAFTTAFLHSVKGFDPTLGAGSKTGCEDSAAFFQVIIRGHKLVYESKAFLYHLHRRDYIALQKQIHNYGLGFTAQLTKSIFDNPWLLFDLAIKIPYALFYILRGRSSRHRNKSSYYPKELNRLEMKGRLYGPLAYIQSRWSYTSSVKS